MHALNVTCAGTVTITLKGKVVVQSGVEIRFKAGAQLIVQNEFRTEGLSLQRILLTSTQADGAKTSGFWEVRITCMRVPRFKFGTVHITYHSVRTSSTFVCMRRRH